MTLRTRLNQIKIWGVRGTLEAVFRMFREKRIRQVLERNARKNENTVPIRGITVVAPISGSFSLSKAMRDFVIRLHSAGFPCQVFDILSGKGIVAEEDFKDLLTPIQEFNVLKYDHVVEMFNSPLPHGLPVKRCRIAFWEGEAGILKVFPYLVDSDIVVAMSDFNARYFRRELPQIVRVAKILYPLLSLPSNTMEKAVARSRFGIGREDFVVFYNFDIRSDYRKNSIGTLKAFAAAFKGDISCRLLLKINGVGRSKDKMVALQTQAESLGIVNHLRVF